MEGARVHGQGEDDRLLYCRHSMHPTKAAPPNYPALALRLLLQGSDTVEGQKGYAKVFRALATLGIRL